MELISETVLTSMERNGWTPQQVRELIASYRKLRDNHTEAIATVANLETMLGLPPDDAEPMAYDARIVVP